MARAQLPGLAESFVFKQRIRSQLLTQAHSFALEWLDFGVAAIILKTENGCSVYENYAREVFRYFRW